MNKCAFTTLLLLSVAVPVCAQDVHRDGLTGPYLGQTPPREGRAVFAPGIVSTDNGNHSSVAITPDGNEMYWSMREKIWFTALRDGQWTEPAVVSFCAGDSYMYDNPFITSDGERMFFTSFRPGAVAADKETIWYVDRTPSGWSEPRPISPAVNEMRLHWSVSVSDAGTIYFQGSAEGSYGRGDIYFAELVDGSYTTPVNIGPALNSGATETCPYIAPDESYLIFTRFDETNVSNTGIFISYRDEAGGWLPPVMVAGGTRHDGGLSPRISPDGKYLFYVNGSEGMYWQPADFVEELRPAGARRPSR